MPTNPLPRRAMLRALPVLFLICVLASQGRSAHAWQDSAPADTSSPRATLESFIDSCNLAYEMIKTDRYFKRDDPFHRTVVRRIFDCIDDAGMPEFEREDRTGEVAVCIKEILDRVELPSYDEIPDAEEIEKDRKSVV